MDKTNKKGIYVVKQATGDDYKTVLDMRKLYIFFTLN